MAEESVDGRPPKGELKSRQIIHLQERDVTTFPTGAKFYKLPKYGRQLHAVEMQNKYDLNPGIQSWLCWEREPWCLNLETVKPLRNSISIRFRLGFWKADSQNTNFRLTLLISCVLCLHVKSIQQFHPNFVLGGITKNTSEIRPHARCSFQKI